MRWLGFSLLPILAGCDSGVPPNGHDQAMTEIEQEVRLPTTAFKLENYARYYARDGSRIIGVYITTVDPKNHHFDLPVGQNRWVSETDDLPVINDGGCSVITVSYDPGARKVESVTCNGEA